ncbi:hypothetical protein PENSPDRAFT_695018 [Peniophora sp. CONT]|nr:hypothetical protein PENSPDRAFT_695018 [Peniophora sp. CONT]
MAPGTSAYRATTWPGYKGFRLLIATVTHPDAILPAVHPNPKHDLDVRAELSRRAVNVIFNTFHALKLETPIFEVVYDREETLRVKIDDQLGQIKILHIVYAIGDTKEERALLTAQLNVLAQQDYNEDERDVVHILRGGGNLGTVPMYPTA